MWPTYNNWHTGFVRDCDDLLEIWNVVLGIANALNVYGFCLIINESFEIFWFVAIDELCVDA